MKDTFLSKTFRMDHGIRADLEHEPFLSFSFDLKF